MADAEQTTAPAAGQPYEFELPDAGGPEPEHFRSDRYLRLLLILLVSAAFFEGYDGSVIALLLPRVQATFHVSEAVLGLTRGFGVAGAFCAFFLARRSDSIGRRPILLWSVAGYTIFTALTAVSWNIGSFAMFQFGANVFLGAEYAVGITMIVEEYPVHRRGRALGVLLTCNALGTIAVAILLLAKLQETSLDWRAFYLVGLVPLVVLAFFRNRLRETQRFVEEKQRRQEGHATPRVPFLEPWKPQYRRNLVLVGLLHLLRSFPLFASTAWWAFYAERERGFTEIDIGIFILVAYGFGTIGYYTCGRLMERIGRRPTAMIYFVGAIVFSITLFQVSGKAVSFVALLLAVFFGLGMGPVMGAFSTELFPTEIRGQAAAWIRNWFEIAGIFFGPLIVGVLGDHAWLVWRYMPETKGLELEEIVEDRIAAAGAVVV
jgi:putative MFS transporter